MRNRYAFVLVFPLLAVVSVPAYADTELTGKWVGPFHGVQIEVPTEAGPFGYEPGEARAIQGPRYIDSTLTISFDSQQKGLAVGSWSARQFKQRVVCAQVGGSTWNCIDATGRSSIEITPASELKVCYLDSRQGALGAGCAILKKSG